ncbi:MAG: hypothetical protein WBG17_04510 [Burkholderiaceae bacterium]
MDEKPGLNIHTVVATPARNVRLHLCGDFRVALFTYSRYGMAMIAYAETDASRPPRLDRTSADGLLNLWVGSAAFDIQEKEGQRVADFFRIPLPAAKKATP